MKCHSIFYSWFDILNDITSSLTSMTLEPTDILALKPASTYLYFYKKRSKPQELYCIMWKPLLGIYDSLLLTVEQILF